MLQRSILEGMRRKAISCGHGGGRAYVTNYLRQLSNSVTGKSSNSRYKSSTFKGTLQVEEVTTPTTAMFVCGLVLAASIYQQNKKLVTQMEYWDHNPEDFDYYVTKSEMTKDHLPILLHKFDHEQLDVWPWIWTHPNNDGPHHVYIGINHDVLDEIMTLCNGKHSEQNNILIVASEEALHKVAMERVINIRKERNKKREDDDADDDNDHNEDNDCMNIYSRYQCGLVTDSQLELLNEDAKILMLDDERVVAYDFLTVL